MTRNKSTQGAEQQAAAGDEEIGARQFCPQPVAEDAANHGPTESAQRQNVTEYGPRFDAQQFGNLVSDQVIGDPPGQGAHAEGHGGHAQRVEHEGRCFQEDAVVAPSHLAAGLDCVRRSRGRLAHQQGEDPQNQPGNHQREERPAPAFLGRIQSADQASQPASQEVFQARMDGGGIEMHHETAQGIAQRRANGHGNVEQREDLSTLGDGEAIREDRRRQRPVRPFAHPHEAAGEQQHQEAHSQAAGPCSQAPDGHAHGDQFPGGKALGQGPEERGGQHVGNQERRSQQPGLAPRHRSFSILSWKERLADLRLHGRQDLAVDVIEEIHRQQQPQGQVGPGDGPRFVSSGFQ